MDKIKATLLSILATGATAAALNINTTPGALSTEIEDAATVTSLTVTGQIDAADLYFIAENLPALNELDLSGVTIAAYSGDAIDGCTNYAEGLIPTGFFAGSHIQSITFPASQSVTIGDGAFTGSRLTSVALGGNIAKVGDGAFSACPDLAAATIGCNALGGATFSACTALVNVTFTNAAEVPALAFAECTALNNVVGSANITAIGTEAFKGCTSLSTFEFGSAITTIGDGAFTMSGLTSADLKQCSNLHSIGAWAFAGDNALRSVEINDNVTNIGQGAFFDCKNLESYNTPAGTSTINAYTLKGANSVDTTNLLTDNVTAIERYALAGLDHVTTITLPHSLESIGDYAMEGWTSVETINADNLSEVPQLGENVWNGIDQSKVILNVSQNKANEFQNADQWQNFYINIVTGIDDPTSLPTLAENIKARFAGSMLQVDAATDEIAVLRMYDLSGALLIDLAPGTTYAETETSHVAGNVFIVYVRLADGTEAAVKLARRF